MDLGTGHGLVARTLAADFDRVTATDPSEGMLKQAASMTPQDPMPHVKFETGTSEEVAPSVESGSVDLVVAAQAAHWFDYERTWPELHRVLREGGTLALWGYSDIVFPDNAKASVILHAYSYGDTALRPYWTMPGRAIVENYYRDIVPSDHYFRDCKREEYVPGTNGAGSGQGEMLMAQTSKVTDIMSYVRTWSAVHKWQQANPPDRRDRPGDIVDWMFEEIAQHDLIFQDPEAQVAIEWGTGLIMARRR